MHHWVPGYPREAYHYCVDLKRVSCSYNVALSAFKAQPLLDNHRIFFCRVKKFDKMEPPFINLPLRRGGPPGNAWGLFGNNDQLGMLNLITPETTSEAAKEIVEGIRISTDLPLDKFSTPAFGRQPFQQKIHHQVPRTVNDDILTFNTQASSQWDGFRHFGV